MNKKTNKIKDVHPKTKPALKKRASPKAEITPPEYPLFTRIQIQTQRQARNLISRILKLLLNGDLLESRAKEARFYIETAIQLNREIQLRARLDKICEVLKLEPLPDEDPEEEDPDLPLEAATDES